MVRDAGVRALCWLNRAILLAFSLAFAVLVLLAFFSLLVVLIVRLR